MFKATQKPVYGLNTGHKNHLNKPLKVQSISHINAMRCTNSDLDDKIKTKEHKQARQIVL